MTVVSYERAETRRTRDELGRRLARLAREADGLTHAVAIWCDDVAQEAEARLGIGPGDEDRDVKLTDPTFNEALDRFRQVEQLAAAARTAADLMKLPDQSDQLDNSGPAVRDHA